MLPPGPLAWDPPLPHRDQKARIWVVLGAIVVILAVAAAFVPLNYDVISPGDTRRVNDLIVAKAPATYPPKGQFLYTTVSVRERVNIYEMAAGWLNGADDVESEKVIRGPIPPQQYEQLNRDLMSDSKRAAEVVALSRLGYRVAQGALIVSVDPSFPGASSLHDNDVVTKVDGKAVSTADDLVAAVRGRHPGDHARLEVKRDKAARDVDVTIGGDAGHPMLGVRVSTDVEPPFDVAIDSGNVVGPSAGLAFALELYDQLTPGELTGGRKVAATGELGLDGKVDAVGGVTQKTISVRRAGADVFLVPRDNYAEARAHAGKHLKVYAIDDFDTALRVLNGSK